MSGVFNRGHFYCTASRIDGRWFIYELPCKAEGIHGGHITACKSRHYAYKLRNLLEKLYRLGAYHKLTRWRFVYYRSPLWLSDLYECSLAYARELLNEVYPDDSRVLSAPIISNGI